MARIVTYEEQVAALKQVGEDIKNLAKMQPLLGVDTNCGRVSVTVIDQEGRKIKSGYTLDKAGVRELLVRYYTDTSKRVRSLLKEHHIEVNNHEKAILDYADNLE